MSENRHLIDKWTDEYAKGGIPSSVRDTPSGSVVWAYGELRRLEFPLPHVIDVGCGKGRNSLYMAEQGSSVTSFDFTPDAIAHLRATAATKNLSPKINALVQDVTEDWPVGPASADLVVDAFCFKHIAPHGQRMAYRENLLRALRSRGHYMIAFASIGDGYYGQYATGHLPGEEGEQLVVDPEIGVESVLYTRDLVRQFFHPELVLMAELQNNKPSVMHGRIYERSTYALLMQRNPHMM